MNNPTALIVFSGPASWQPGRFQFERFEPMPRQPGSKVPLVVGIVAAALTALRWLIDFPPPFDVLSAPITFVLAAAGLTVAWRAGRVTGLRSVRTAVVLNSLALAVNLWLCVALLLLVMALR